MKSKSKIVAPQSKSFEVFFPQRACSRQIGPAVVVSGERVSPLTAMQSMIGRNVLIVRMTRMIPVFDFLGSASPHFSA
jgi:hypothetical protein